MKKLFIPVISLLVGCGKPAKIVQTDLYYPSHIVFDSAVHEYAIETAPGWYVVGGYCLGYTDNPATWGYPQITSRLGYEHTFKIMSEAQQFKALFDENVKYRRDWQKQQDSVQKIKDSINQLRHHYK